MCAHTDTKGITNWITWTRTICTQTNFNVQRWHTVDHMIEYKSTSKATKSLTSARNYHGEEITHSRPSSIFGLENYSLKNMQQLIDYNGNGNRNRNSQNCRQFILTTHTVIGSSKSFRKKCSPLMRLSFWTRVYGLQLILIFHLNIKFLMFTHQ